MIIEDPDLDDLFRDDLPGMADESRHAPRTIGGGHEGSSNGTRRGGFTTIRLRIKPDRRRLVTRVDPASERRHDRR